MNPHPSDNHGGNGAAIAAYAALSQHTMPMRPSSPSNPLREMLSVLFRFWRRAAIFFVVSLATVVVALVLWPRTYSSEAKLFVRAGRGATVTMDPTVTRGPAVSVSPVREAEVSTAMEVMGNWGLLSNLVDAVGADRPITTPLDRDKAIIRLHKNLRIWSPAKTGVIGMQYLHESPHKAQRTLDKLIALFLAEHLRVNTTLGSYEFFEEQSESIKQQLDQKTAELLDLKNQFELTSIAGRRLILDKQFGQIRSKRFLNETSRSASQARIAALKGEFEHLPDLMLKQFAAGLPMAAANIARQQLYELQKREQTLLSKVGEHHPELVAVRQQIEEARATLEVEQPDRAQATSGNLVTEIVNESALAAQTSVLERQYAALQEELQALNEQELQITRLQRDVELLETKYRTYVENLEQARIDRALQQEEITNISVIQPPTLLLKPTSPKKGTTLILGFICAGTGALALAFLSHQLDTTLSSSEQIEQCLELPVLASIPGSGRYTAVEKEIVTHHDSA